MGNIRHLKGESDLQRNKDILLNFKLLKNTVERKMNIWASYNNFGNYIKQTCTLAY